MQTKHLILGALSFIAGLGAATVYAAAPATPQGMITARYFLNIGGTAVADLTGNAKFPNSPDMVRYEPYFEAWAGGEISTPAANDVRNSYGTQLVGYFYPETTGDYVFFLSADDNAALYLSPDDTPANKKLIAEETVWSNPREYDISSGASVLESKRSDQFANSQWATPNQITLQAGRAYYIEALAKEGGGGDNLSVSIDGITPIAGDRLSPFAVASSAAILAQPSDALLYEGSAGQFFVGLDVPPGTTLTSIEWQKNGVAIADSDTTDLTLPVTAADNGAKVRAVVTTSTGTLTSSEATISVVTLANEFAPGVVKFEAYRDIGGGTAVSDLTSNQKFIDGVPDDIRLIAGVNSPNAFGDSYGAKVSGFVTPPETGSYRFFLRSDDASELWLSPDANEANAVLIAEEIGCCDGFKEPDDTLIPNFETSGPQSLQAGQRYAFYVLLKEGGGGDYVQVAVREEGDTTPAGAAPLLAGNWVGVNAKPSLGDPEITQQPQGIPQLIEGKTGVLTVRGRVNPEGFNFPLLVQWQKDGQDIPGATSQTLTITNAAAANSGTYRAVVSAPSGQTLNSAEATVAVVPDTFPPEPVVGAVKNLAGTYDVGVTFDEPVDAAAETQANYTISTGTITGFAFFPKSPGAVLTVSGLIAGNTYSVTVSNVGDTKGNKITSTTTEFTAGNLTWGVVGGSELNLGNGVVAVGENGFDLYSDSIAEWATYDEATFVYEEVTGDFDKKLRVEYQDASSQWARAGLIARDVTNIGVDRATQEGGEAGRYQKVHVNPVVTAMGTAGNNSWEGNRRLAKGSATTTAGGNGTPQYPNAWVRLQRQADLFTIYRSDDGVNWTQMGTTTFEEPMPATLFVGPEFAPENGNIGEDTGLRAVWLAKLRDYGDTFDGGNGGDGPTLTVARTASGLTLTFTGTLESAESVLGPWTAVPGGSPQNVQTTGAARFYRARE